MGLKPANILLNKIKEQFKKLKNRPLATIFQFP